MIYCFNTIILSIDKTGRIFIMENASGNQY
jgi:hypothetical protein